MPTKRIALIALVLVGFAIYGWAQVVPKPQPLPEGLVSGADIGFRVERTEANAAIGRLMVRVNGKWVEAQFSYPGKAVPVQAK